MIAEGVLDEPKVDAVFGLHVCAGLETGDDRLPPRPDARGRRPLRDRRQGRQTHGAKPGPASTRSSPASEIVTALQTMVSRTLELTREPVVVTVGQFEAGVRSNIIPDRARLVGTIRTFDEAMRDDLARAHAADRRERRGGPRRHGHGDVRARLSGDRERRPRWWRSCSRRSSGWRPGGSSRSSKITVSEDFSLFAHRVPGLFLILGVTPADRARDRGGQPLADVLRRRVGAPYRRARLRPGRRRLPLRACESEGKAA